MWQGVRCQAIQNWIRLWETEVRSEDGGGGALLDALSVSDVVQVFKEFGTGFRGFAFLWSVLIAWILRFYLPERYKVKMEFQKFLLEHQERIKKLDAQVAPRKNREARDGD